MMKRIRVALPVLLAILSCRPPGPVKNAAQQPPLPSAEAALDQLRQASGQRKNLRASGRLTYFGEKGRVRLQAVIVAERPGSFRFETISPLLQPIDVMACDGEKLWLLSKEKLHEGPATPENIARLMPLPMAPEEVVDTLLGGVPTGTRFTPTGIAWDEKDHEKWVLTIAGPAGETGRLTVDPVHKVVEKMELLEEGGNVRLGVTFEDFERASDNGSEIPRDLHIVMPSRNHDVTIKLKEVDVNVDLPRSLFSIQAPPGVTPEALGAL